MPDPTTARQLWSTPNSAPAASPTRASSTPCCRFPATNSFLKPCRAQAYEDHPLPIGDGQTISQPYIVALMLESLQLLPNDIVLEVGTGSGYVTALLAELAAQVFSVERHASLAESARGALAALGYTNVRVFTGDGALGLSACRPVRRYPRFRRRAPCPSRPALSTPRRWTHDHPHWLRPTLSNFISSAGSMGNP